MCGTRRSYARRARPALRVLVLGSLTMQGQAGYSTLIGRIRDNIRTLIRKQIELPKQEITEILQANLRAVKWFAVAAAFAVMLLVGIVILLVTIVGGLLSLLLPYPWALAVG